MVLATDEGRRVAEQQRLALWIHCEDAADDGARAVLRAALARPRRTVEGVEAVVDRDLFALLDRPPGEDLDTMSHRVGIAGVIEVAARRCENSEPVESELAQVDPLALSGLIEFGRREDSGVAAAEDELAIVERPARVYAAALRAGVRTSTSPIMALNPTGPWCGHLPAVGGGHASIR